MDSHDKNAADQRSGSSQRNAPCVGVCGKILGCQLKADQDDEMFRALAFFGQASSTEMTSNTYFRAVSASMPRRISGRYLRKRPKVLQQRFPGVDPGNVAHGEVIQFREILEHGSLLMDNIAGDKLF